MNTFTFLLLTLVVFFVLLIFVMPKILYFATLIYHALFKKDKKKGKGKKSYLRLKDLKAIRSERMR